MPATKKLNKSLPRNWRQKVSEELKKQGITKTSRQIQDIFRKPVNDKKILAAAIKARNKVAKEYAEILKLKRQLVKK